jgi:hypothetical protein
VPVTLTLPEHFQRGSMLIDRTPQPVPAGALSGLVLCRYAPQNTMLAEAVPVFV